MALSNRKFQEVGLDEFIGRRLEQARKKRGIGRDQVWTHINATSNKLYRYEAGMQHIPVVDLLKLADLFRMRLSFFFPPLLGADDFKRSHVHD